MRTSSNPRYERFQQFPYVVTDSEETTKSDYVTKNVEEDVNISLDVTLEENLTETFRPEEQFINKTGWYEHNFFIEFNPQIKVYLGTEKMQSQVSC